LIKGKRKEMLKIFTPEENVERINSICNKLKRPYEINPDASLLGKKDTVLHYRSRYLDQDIKDILVYHIKYGGTSMPLVDYLDKKLGYHEIDLLNSDYFLHHRSFTALRKKTRYIPKRLCDIINSSILFVIFLPIMMIAALAIKLDSPGSVFYRQKRVGKFNREFEVIKFRSMRNDAEKDGAKWATKDDDRITKVGNFIHQTRIDELPQLLNVIKGDMSLVGPRPERKVFVEELAKEIPYYRFRHAVKPGITGYAQVKFPYGASLEDAKWKHRYDIYYIKYQSIWMDMKIILLTIKTVLSRDGR